MKKIYTILTAVLITASVFLPQQAGAQTPEAMSYQAVIRNASNQLVTNQGIGMQISILQGSATGTAVYVETHNTTTNANGLVTVELGNGTVVSGDFATIDWSADTYFIKTETDPTTAGGTSYTITGTSQLLSVAYALQAKKVENVDYSQITNTPNLFDGDWSSLTGTAPNMSIFNNDAGYLTSYTETDPTFTAWDKSTGISITESQISDFGTYLTSETDPVYSANFDLTGTANGDLLKFDGTKFVKFTPNYLTSYTETDPIFTAWDKDYADLINTPANATTTTDGFMSSADKTKLDGLTNADGSETKVTAGTNVTVTGVGTIASPYVVNASTYSVGDFAQGGIVFWVDETGQHGLVCAKSDQNGGSGVRWYAGTYGNTQAKGDGPYAGEANTSIIIAAQVAIGDDGNTYAARICNELQITEGGKTYGDWYLPSKEELNLMYQNKATIDATATTNSGSGFASDYYWSSTEYINSHAWIQYFNDGGQFNSDKYDTYRVRAVRAF